MDWPAVTSFSAGILVAMLVFSFVAVVLYAWDKRRAKRGGWRVPENVLHAMELLGGWPGALLASKLFRHKSRKASYRIVRAMCILAHVLAVAGLLAWAGMR